MDVGERRRRTREDEGRERTREDEGRERKREEGRKREEERGRGKKKEKKGEERERRGGRKEEKGEEEIWPAAGGKIGDLHTLQLLFGNENMISEQNSQRSIRM